MGSIRFHPLPPYAPLRHWSFTTPKTKQKPATTTVGMVPPTLPPGWGEKEQTGMNGASSGERGHKVTLISENLGARDISPSPRTSPVPLHSKKRKTTREPAAEKTGMSGACSGGRIS